MSEVEGGRCPFCMEAYHDGRCVPVRLCCMQRHTGSICPDGKVMCCLCFDRVPFEELAEEDGTKTDVCMPCWRQEHPDG